MKLISSFILHYFDGYIYSLFSNDNIFLNTYNRHNIFLNTYNRHVHTLMVYLLEYLGNVNEGM